MHAFIEIIEDGVCNLRERMWRHVSIGIMERNREKKRERGVNLAIWCVYILNGCFGMLDKYVLW